MTDFLAVGNAGYDSGSVNVTRRFSRGLAFTASYTFSKTIDDSTNELNSSAVNARRPEDGFNLRNERGLSANDIPHRFVFGGNYELPFFRDSRNEAVRFLLGGFELAGIFQAQSGQPFTPRSAVDSNLNDDAAGDRAIFNAAGVAGTASRVCPVNAAGQLMTGTGATTVTVGGVTSPVTLANCGLGNYGPAGTVAYVAVNPNAQFVQAGFGARTTTARNTIRSNGFNRTDMTLLKNFRFGDEARYNVQVGAEVFNLFNQRIRTLGAATGSQSSVIVGAPSGVNVQGAFANVNSAFFNDYSTGVFGGRTVQVRAKFIF